MTADCQADLQDRLYKAYVTQHVGCGGDEVTALVNRRDIRPLLPSPAGGPVIDLGCGRGELVRLLQAADHEHQDLIRAVRPGYGRAPRVTLGCPSWPWAAEPQWHLLLHSAFGRYLSVKKSSWDPGDGSPA